MSSIENYLRLATHVRNWWEYFKRKERKKQTAKYVTRGIPLWFEVPFDFYYVFKEIFLEDFYHLGTWLPQVPENAIIIDIGANVGYFSFLMASKKSQSTVYAFEPMKKNSTVFQKNISINPNLQKRIILTEEAVTGTQTGLVTMFFDSVNDNSVISSVYDDFSASNNQSLQVKSIRLSDVIEQYDLKRIDILKMDCEGSEYPILYDSPEAIWPLINCIVIEVHDMDIEKRNAAYLFKFLSNKGFAISSKTESTGCYSAVAIKKRNA